MAEARDYDDSVVTAVRPESVDIDGLSDNSIVTVVSKLPEILAAEDALTADVVRSQPATEVERTEPDGDAVPGEPIPKHAAVSASILAPPARVAPTLPTAPKPALDVDTAVTSSAPTPPKATPTVTEPEPTPPTATPPVTNPAPTPPTATPTVDVDTAVTYTALEEETFTAALQARGNAAIPAPLSGEVVPREPKLPREPEPPREPEVRPSALVLVPVFDPTARIDKQRTRATRLMASRSVGRRRIGDVALAIAAVVAVVAFTFVAVRVLREEPPATRESASPPARVTEPTTTVIEPSPEASNVVEASPEPAPIAIEPPAPAVVPPPAAAPVVAPVVAPAPAPTSAIDDVAKKRVAKPAKKKQGWDPDALFFDDE